MERRKYDVRSVRVQDASGRCAINIEVCARRLCARGVCVCVHSVHHSVGGSAATCIVCRGGALCNRRDVAAVAAHVVLRAEVRIELGGVAACVDLAQRHRILVEGQAEEHAVLRLRDAAAARVHPRQLEQRRNEGVAVLDVRAQLHGGGGRGDGGSAHRGRQRRRWRRRRGRAVKVDDGAIGAARRV